MICRINTLTQAGSDLINLMWFNPVFKVIAQKPGVEAKGTGFLLRVAKDPLNDVLGLITCYHVVSYFDSQNRAHPVDPGQIDIEFESKAIPRMNLGEIQKPNTRPFYSEDHDLYFILISDKFASIMENNSIKFFDTMEASKDNQIWIPQYPEGEPLHVATALLVSEWTSEIPINPHKVSTRAGSSGAPLLQLYNNELRVIGMHLGKCTNPTQNIASTIENIMSALKQLIHGEVPEIPSLRILLGADSGSTSSMHAIFF